MNIWKWTKRALVVALFLVASHFLYQLQLGAIPALLFSFYLFRLAWKEIKKSKNRSELPDKDQTREKDKSYEKTARAK